MFLSLTGEAYNVKIQSTPYTGEQVDGTFGRACGAPLPTLRDARPHCGSEP